MSTTDSHERLRKSTVSPEVMAAKKPEKKSPRTFRKEEEWVEVPERKEPRKKEPKPRAKKRVSSRLARPVAVLIKLAEGVSYVTILRSLKSRVNPEGLGLTDQGMRETHSKVHLVKMRCAAKDRDRLGTVHHLVSRIQVEILDLEPTTEEAEV